MHGGWRVGRRMPMSRFTRSSTPCARLWGVDAAGLRAIQAAYRDLYAPAPENGQSSAGHVKEDAPEYRAQADGQEATP